ncbi:MAG: hypothetical protein FWD57_12625 [Polyangiaceae bacterium]|nr:hypothetical protein [Polyangiaceae bacterium]
MRSSATTKRLIGDPDHGLQCTIWNIHHYGWGSISLLYDLGLDANLRAAWTYDNRDSSDHVYYSLFSKVTDQLYDAVIKDQNDMAVIAANLECSIKGWTCQ